MKSIYARRPFTLYAAEIYQSKWKLLHELKNCETVKQVPLLLKIEMQRAGIILVK